MLLAAAVMVTVRKDLVMTSLLSGVLMALVSFPSYLLVVLISPNWIDHTYLWWGLSGTRFIGVPIEEFIFWFLSGLVFGPFYEYWQGERLKAMRG
jgi:uncharacterized membrane protein